MKLKGRYSGDVKYSVGDVVLNSDDVVYILHKNAKAGTNPMDALYWSRLHQPMDEVVKLIMDAAVALEDETEDYVATQLEKYFVNDQTLLLKAGEGESEKTYAITVDASGDTPELAVEEVSDEGGEG